MIENIKRINKDYKLKGVKLSKKDFENNSLSYYYNFCQENYDIVTYNFEVPEGSASLTVYNFFDDKDYYYEENEILQKHYMKKDIYNLILS